jgi:phosphopantothenoylcysteine decarboxylase/phosphopantothenate--cysteine ligase
MNPEMWENRATQENLVRLKHLGYEIIDPDEGSMACETVGVGRMPEPETLYTVIEKYLQEESALREKLSGRKVIVTAGPTREAIDPVRYLSNRSSGKMGYAIARAAVRAGADTTLISGPVALDPVRGASMHYIESTDSLCKEVMTHFESADCLIMAAAPADFAPSSVSKTKIKKQSGSPADIPLRATVDILSRVSSSRKSHQRVVGFALETDHALANAKSKLTEKKLDLIVLNSLSDPGAGFEHDTNKLTLIHKGGKSENWPLMSKREAAIRLIRTVANLF